MTQAGDLPAGYRLQVFDSLDSTNSEALRRAQAGEPDRLWIWARTQVAGRGRAGRSWVSPPGNLYASLLLRLDCPLETSLQLAFVAGLAAYDAVAACMPDTAAQRLALKWPNDLLLDGVKLSGILLESAATAGEGAYVIAMGTGINLASHPDDTPQPATDLAMHGIDATPPVVLQRLAVASEAWLQAWDGGEGFNIVRAAWETRAIPVGQPIRVRLKEGDRDGIYGGIDASGALRLMSNGTERRVSAGDVFVI